MQLPDDYTRRNLLYLPNEWLMMLWLLEQEARQHLGGQEETVMLQVGKLHRALKIVDSLV